MGTPPVAPSRLEIVNTRLSAYLAAETAILAGQSYSIGGRSLVRANLAEIRDEIRKLINERDQLSQPNGGAIRIRSAIPG
jgi:hypothetical protein